MSCRRSSIVSAVLVVEETEPAVAEPTVAEQAAPAVPEPVADLAKPERIARAGTLPTGLAMLFAAAAGALLIALFGAARVLQLRRAAHRRQR
jgi:hypothetical protein